MHGRPFLVAVIVGLAGVALLGVGFASWKRDRNRLHWPTVPASLISATLVKTTKAEVRRALHSPSRTARAETRLVDVWAVDVDYRYSVDGREFRGSHATSSPVFEEIDPSQDAPGAELQALAREVKQLTPGAAHVNPRNPTESYLLFRPGLVTSALIWGFVLTAVAVSTAVATRR
jgi:hypothetical protein